MSALSAERLRDVVRYDAVSADAHTAYVAAAHKLFGEFASAA